MQLRPRAALPLWARGAVAVGCTLLYVAAVPLTVAVYGVDLVPAFVVATLQLRFARSGRAAATTGGRAAPGGGRRPRAPDRGSAEGTWPLPVAGLLSLGGLVLLLGLRERSTLAVGTWWTSVVLLVVLVASSPERYAVPDVWGTNLAVYASASAALLVISISLAQRRRVRAELLAARRDVELEQSRRRLVEERARIARDLHDVVAHSMSLVHIQALSAPYRLDRAPRATVDAEFGDLAGLAAAALAEMRQLLGVLRTESAEPALSPQPQVAAVADLVAGTERAGTPVRADVDPRAHEVGAVVQVTAYRIVQEALSNVVRHAPGAPTTVTLLVEDGLLRVRVRNAPRPPGGPAPRPLDDRGGNGLRGMAERADLVGGAVDAGPLDEGGFLVEATLPTPATLPVEELR